MLDTIAAISSGGIVNQAISIIRIVGDDALEIIKKIFTGPIGPNKTIQYGWLKDENNNLIDEVLVNFFIGKDNFVGETTVEINAHGGIVISKKILDLVLSNGARLAKEGEFTRRAFLNGKISLIKAEAINDLIHAKTSKQHEIAINSFNKEKEDNINNFIKKIEYLIGLCEVNIDYPEYDDIPILENNEFNEKIFELIDELKQIVNSSQANQIYYKPISISIVGSPNAGKSSLMNEILNEERSIVTNIPGTTRDIVESEIIYNNFLIKFKDTAGIRKTNDEIEKIGVEKSWKEIDKSDVIVHVIDSSKGKNEFDLEIESKIKNKKYIQLWNKSDLIKNKDNDKLYISTKNHDLKKFNEAFEKLINLNDNNDLIQTYNERQTYCLKKALKALENAKKSISENLTYDIIILDLHNSWEALKEIIGNVNKEELIDSIFKNFCLGK